MKKQLSTLDLHFLVEELSVLKGSRVDKVYHPEKNTLIFGFYRSDISRKLLKIEIGTVMFLAESKASNEELLDFGSFLRKRIDGYFVDLIKQAEPERIVKFVFRLKNDCKILYVEFFGKGNAVLCDDKGVILNCLIKHEFKDRTIKPKEIYRHPNMSYDVFRLDESSLKSLLQNSEKESLVKCLAVELGLGGIYAEEACLLAGLDKNSAPKKAHSENLLSGIKKVLDKKLSPQVILENGRIIDVAPFNLEYYKDFDRKPFESFSRALECFYSEFEVPKETEFDKRLRGLQRIADSQRAAIDEMKKEELELRGKAELVYAKYVLVKEVLEELNKASKKHSWKEIKEKLKGHKMITELNDKERKVIIDI